MAAAGKRHLAQLDGLRGPLCIGVIAINMNLYDVGANLPVGVFLIASGITAYLAYGDRKWDDASHFEFFKKRLVRLLPMVLVSSCFQVCASAVWLDHQASDFAGNLLSVALLGDALVLLPAAAPRCATPPRAATTRMLFGGGGKEGEGGGGMGGMMETSARRSLSPFEPTPSRAVSSPA